MSIKTHGSVLCGQESRRLHCEYILTLTGRKETVFHACIGYATQQILLNSQQPFARYGHSKVYFNFLASISFRTLCKHCYKMQTCNSIASIFGTTEEHITVDSRTKFVVNLRNIQGVMSIYSCKKDQISVTATG